MVSFVVPARYCGPPESGNGGWVSGHLAAEVSTTSDRPAVAVRLTSPPPLARELDLVRDTESVRVVDGDHLVASAAPAPPLVGEVPAPVAYAEAAALAAAYEGWEHHPFPTCFSCGTRREPGDGLGLRPAPVPGRNSLYAAAWVPGEVSPEVVWAALDCPSGWAAGVAEHPMVLGTMTAQVFRLPQLGAEHVVIAWRRGASGRKHLAGSALLDGSGSVLARAEATWIAVDPTGIRPVGTRAGQPGKEEA